MSIIAPEPDRKSTTARPSATEPLLGEEVAEASAVPENQTGAGSIKADQIGDTGTHDHGRRRAILYALIMLASIVGFCVYVLVRRDTMSSVEAGEAALLIFTVSACLVAAVAEHFSNTSEGGRGASRTAVICHIIGAITLAAYFVGTRKSEVHAGTEGLIFGSVFYMTSLAGHAIRQFMEKRKNDA